MPGIVGTSADDRQKAEPGDITRRLRAQDAAELPFTTVAEALQEGVLVQDDQGRVLQANRTAAKILGLALDELVTDPPSSLFWIAEVDGLPMTPETSPGRRALAEGEPILGVIVGIDHGEQRRWLEINSVPIRLPSASKIPMVISSFRDITARVATDEAVRFQTLLLDTAGQGIVAVDARGIVLYWNKHAEQMYGWSAQEAVGQPVTELILPAAAAAAGRELVDELQPGETHGSDYWVTRRDGTQFPVFATSTPAVDDDGHTVAMITVATDITDRKRVEDQARRLSAIVEASSDAIVGLTLDRVITSWNAGATALYGYEEHEALGRNVAMLTAPLEHQDIEARLGAQDLALSNLETRCVTKQGAVVYVALSVSPILDENGRAVGLCGIGRDVTERVELERRAEENRDQLRAARHAAELEALGREEANRANRAKSEFLSRMSHELRTPLNTILGFAQILLMDDLTADQRENVSFLRSAGDHLLALVNDVLDISRIESGGLKLVLEPVHVNEVVAHALSLIRPQATDNRISIPEGIDGDDDIYVHSDRQRLMQILLNLLSNAVKYNRPDGRIELCCETSGGTVSIAVTDTGLGIGDADLNKLFTPFERLGAERSTIEGTGIGLALSRVLSQEMGGSLTVFSTAGTGSTFTLELPVGHPPDERALSDAGLPAIDHAADSKQLTILAIEDNLANIALLERAVRRCDNVVLHTAIQGRRGLEIAAQHQPGLILLDLHLPDLPGETVLARLRANPSTASIPVVICSADSSLLGDRQRVDLDADAYLTKPIDLSALFGLIERARTGDGLTPPATPT
jgi:PAS domain S-box-containing protein